MDYINSKVSTVYPFSLHPKIVYTNKIKLKDYYPCTTSWKDEMILMAYLSSSSLETHMAEVGWRKFRNHLILIAAAVLLLLLAMYCVPECPPR